jgi:tRNA(adenine34) deaminase
LPTCALCVAPIAQLDRATDYESVGQRFESSWARHSSVFTEEYAECAEFIIAKTRLFLVVCDGLNENCYCMHDAENKTDEGFMRKALMEAEKAAACGETPIGAVLVIGDEVIAAAHNMREAWQDPAAHAELIVVRKASARLGRWRLQDATVYVTLEPCLMCAGAMVLARIDRLVYGCRDPKAGAFGSVYDVVRDGRLNHTYRITPGILEADCRDRLQSFFEKLRIKTTDNS